MQKSSRKTKTKGLNLMASICIGVGLLGCAKTSFSPEQISDGILVNPDQSMTEKIIVGQDRPLTPVDVLFVIDNSRSMREEQGKLSQRLDRFVEEIGGTDWQIGITTTDVSNASFATKGSLVDIHPGSSPNNGNRKILNRSSSNYKKLFADSIQKHGTPQDCQDTGENCPSGYEQPMKAIYQAILKRNLDNKGFFRKQADLAVIIISDEDEESENEDLMRPLVLNSFMKSELGDNKRVNVYGIIHQPEDKKCLDSDTVGARYGKQIDLLTQLTGGFSVSICEPDYAKPLTEIGQRVLRTPYNVKLSKKPAPGTVKVILNPVQENIQWKVEGNQVILSDWPAKNSEILVTYDPVQ